MSRETRIDIILKHMQVVYPLTDEAVIKGWKFDCVHHEVHSPNGKATRIPSAKHQEFAELWERAAPCYAEAAYHLVSGIPEVMLAHIAYPLMGEPWRNIEDVQRGIQRIIMEIASRAVRESGIARNKGISAVYSFPTGKGSMYLEMNDSNKYFLTLNLGRYPLESISNIRRVTQLLSLMIDTFKLITQGGDDAA